jgi:hypothetical protein
MTSDLGLYLAHALTDDRLRLARQRQVAARHEADAAGCASYARRRRWMRRLRVVLFPGARRRVVRHA